MSKTATAFVKPLYWDVPPSWLTCKEKVAIAIAKLTGEPVTGCRAWCVVCGHETKHRFACDRSYGEEGRRCWAGSVIVFVKVRNLTRPYFE